MPYQTFNWTNGTPLNEENLNTYVRDNMDALNSDIDGLRLDFEALTGSPHVNIPANKVFASPDGAVGVPSWRSLNLNDLGLKGMLEITSLTQISSPVSSFTINVPSTYDHLQIWTLLRSNNANIGDGVLVRLSGDVVNGNYASMSGRLTHSATWTTIESLGANPGLLFGATITGNSAPSGLASLLILDIYNYSSSTQYKFVSMRGTRIIGTTTGNIMGITGHGCWTNTNPVTSITFLPGAGTQFISPSSYAAFGLG